MDNRTISKIKYYASVVAIGGIFLGGVYLSSIPGQNRREREKKEQIEYVQWEKRMDSLQNLDHLISRLDGFCAEAEYFGNTGFYESLELKYEQKWGQRNDTMPKFMKVTFEDYLTHLYVVQEKNKLDKR